MYLLDTNIVSLLDPRRKQQAGPLLGWMRTAGSRLFLSAMSIAEIEKGILKLRREARHAPAEEYARLRDAILTDFADRILPMDTPVALLVSRMSERARPAQIDLSDLIIAATAEAHGMVVLTRNLKHFAPTGVAALDPLVELPDIR